MSSVKRFDVGPVQDLGYLAYSDMEPSERGGYVTYSAYRLLEVKIERLEKYQRFIKANAPSLHDRADNAAAKREKGGE